MIDNSKAQTPLHTALINSQLELAQSFVAQGKFIDDQDENGETALFLAVEFEDVFRILVNAGADVKISNFVGETPLHEAATNGTVTECELILEYGANINAQDDRGQSPLHGAAAYGNHAIVKLLIENGANVNQLDGQGKTPLHYAVYGNIMRHELNNYLLTAEKLIQAGADLSVKTKEGITALALAERHSGYPELAALLIRHGAE